MFEVVDKQPKSNMILLKYRSHKQTDNKNATHF